MNIISNFNRKTLIAFSIIMLLGTGGLLLHAQEPLQEKGEYIDSSIHSAFQNTKKIRAGVLDVGYAEVGPKTGKPVILLHGWPYDIHSFEKSSELLSSKGYRVLIPYLRGYGTTTFVSPQTMRNGQQSAVALDIIAFMDALKIDKAIVGGFDWGARTADIMAALWPERVSALVAVSGYLIGSPEINKKPLSPNAEFLWWYQYYFSTERGYKGYKANTNAFNKLIWKTASPKWSFDEETYQLSAKAFENPDHVGIVIHNYRWRLGLAQGEKQYDKLEAKLAKLPDITVPTVTLEGDANGAAFPLPENYASKYKGKYMHHTLTGGIGHNLPQEAPKEFAVAIMEADVLSH
ncbi:alpha/beta fold hydrolase [Chryseobacterium sp. Mn2064]|uniref:alpha/beta fold hydrolase n=1 Tax=Chryseobacterium sp. Mn2064 TaxID=3395263 RepID=UPI003BE8DF30